MTPGPRSRIVATVHGKVQDVGFRYWTRRQAHQLGLVGTVANRPDGTVHVVAEGEADAVDRLVRWLDRGPRASRVERVEVVRAAPVGNLTDFEIVAG